MDELLQLFQNKEFWVLAVGYWLLSAFVDSLEPLPDTAGYWTRTVYKFAHIIVGSLSTAGFKLPFPTKPKDPPSNPDGSNG